MARVTVAQVARGSEHQCRRRRADRGGSLIVVYEKFFGGADLVVILIPLLVGMMLFIRRQYTSSARELAVSSSLVFTGPLREERVIIPVNAINRAVIQAVNVGRSVATDVRAVLISDHPEEAAKIRDRWSASCPTSRW